MSDEEWRPVVGHEGLYEVSDHGRVRSLDRYVERSDGVLRFFPGVTLSPSADKDGYKTIGLKRNGTEKRTGVHRLVLRAFVGPCPQGMEARHLDGDPANNALGNLCWSTHVVNESDKVRHGTRVLTVHCPRRHLLVAPNLTTYRHGCLACNRMWSAVRRAHERGITLDRQIESDRRYVEIMSEAAMAS